MAGPSPESPLPEEQGGHELGSELDRGPEIWIISEPLMNYFNNNLYLLINQKKVITYQIFSATP